MGNRCKLHGTLTPILYLQGNLAPTKTLKGGLTIPAQWAHIDKYEGPYEVTPERDSEVILDTKNKQATANIVVKPIPKNYGLITRTGAKLTIT